MADEDKSAFNVREFSEVILTLDNVLLPAEKLSPTPSMIDGIDNSTEMDLRILGCELIQISGILLKLPQVAMAAGQVIFQRFYHAKSFVKHNLEVVVMASINLASKIEEAPRRIRDVINVCHHIKQMRNGKTITPLILDQAYINLKNQVIKAERRILKELGFCVHIKHPHKIIVTFLQFLECERNRVLVQTAWNYMNDSFRANVFVRFTPETIACSCIYLAARKLQNECAGRQLPLPNNPPWFFLFKVDEDDIREICRTILQLYERPKPNPEELERILNEAKKRNVEAKIRAKGLAAGFTPTSSRPSTPCKVSPLLLAQQQLKKLRSEDDRSDSSFGGRDHNHVTRRKRTHSRSPRRSRSRDSGARRSSSRSPSPAGRLAPRRPTSPLAKKFRKEMRMRERRRARDKQSTKRDRRAGGRYRSASYSPAVRSYSRSPPPAGAAVARPDRRDKDGYRARDAGREGGARSKKKHGGRRHRSRDRYRR